MKALFLTIICLLLAAGSVWGQAGSIGIFPSAAANCCLLDDKTVGLTLYYVVHVYTPGATACQYWAPRPACFTGAWLSDTNMFPVTIGNSQTGVSVGYGSCRVGPIHVQTLNFFTMGTTPACCYYPVRPDPNEMSGHILVVDCNDHLIYGTGGTGIINGALQCSCGYLCPVPVEETTWGEVKSLYSD